MAHCKYSHHHPTPLSFGQCPGPTVLLVCVPRLLPTRAALGMQFTGESAATPKKVSLQGSNKHNFIKWNGGIKKKVADSIWHPNEITINREDLLTSDRQDKVLCLNPLCGVRVIFLAERSRTLQQNINQTCVYDHMTNGGDWRDSTEFSSAKFLKSCVQQIHNSKKCWIKVTGNNIY